LGASVAVAHAFASYIPIDQAVTARRKMLRNQYHFECDCVRCVAEMARGKSDLQHHVVVMHESKLGDAEMTEAEDVAATADAALSIKSTVKKLKPADIKKQLRSLGLSAQGPKKDLISRLVDGLIKADATAEA
jgi:hypothetical protein